MALDPTGALQAAAAPSPPARVPRVAPLLLVGGAGLLGGELLTQALARGPVQVATVAPLRVAMRGLEAVPLPARGAMLGPAGLPPLARHAAIVFDRARGVQGREDAFFLPETQQLVGLATWLRASGVHTLAVVQPHAPALLPAALRHGLTTLDEQAVAALGFERLLLVRPTQYAGAAPDAGRSARFMRWWWSQLALMLPASERPLRAVHVAAFVLEALAQWPRGEHGTRVAGAEALWAATRQGGAAAAVRSWLQPGPVPDAG